MSALFVYVATASRAYAEMLPELQAVRLEEAMTKPVRYCRYGYTCLKPIYKWGACRKHYAKMRAYNTAYRRRMAALAKAAIAAGLTP